MRRQITTLIAVASALALPAAAQASVVQTTSKGELRIGALGGETNFVKVKYRASGQPWMGRGGGFVVTDRAGAVPADPSCLLLGKGIVGCDATGLNTVSVVLGDGDDTLRIRTGRNGGVPSRISTFARGDGGNDVIRSGTGADRLFGSHGRDVLGGWKGPDRLHGGADRDGLLGFAGDDVLLGGAGGDVLFGMRGRDRLFGGTGPDVLLARDFRRDRVIHCGPGAASRESAITDGRDPRPISC